jgi:glycosyltransferase involved in cell wall biosynthesis
MYDYVIVTHIPVFYKVNLYNELAKELKILVIFIASDTNEVRADDFITLDNVNFEYRVLHKGDIQNRDILSNIQLIKAILKQCQYKKILVGGWDLKEFWFLVFSHPKSNNYLNLESTINESRTDIIRSFIKKIFLNRISLVFAPGNLHKALLDKLNYKGDIKITKGVGIINKPNLNIVKKTYKKKYLFIGRLSKEKNIEMLVDVFNGLKEHTLTIIGTGPLENNLKKKARENIIFKGKIKNKELKTHFEENNLLILTSVSETWGLVVEEALYYKVPVIISNNCGVREIIKEGVNGYVVDIESARNVKETILSLDSKTYDKLINGVNKISVEAKDSEQLRAYFVK